MKTACVMYLKATEAHEDRRLLYLAAAPRSASQLLMKDTNFMPEKLQSIMNENGALLVKFIVWIQSMH